MAAAAPTIAALPAFCVECEDQPPALRCTNCNEVFCRPCFGQQHHRGKRSQHVTEVLLGELLPQPLGSEATGATATATATADPASSAQQPAPDEPAPMAVDDAVTDAQSPPNGSAPAQPSTTSGADMKPDAKPGARPADPQEPVPTSTTKASKTSQDLSAGVEDEANGRSTSPLDAATPSPVPTTSSVSKAVTAARQGARAKAADSSDDSSDENSGARAANSARVSGSSSGDEDTGTSRWVPNVVRKVVNYIGGGGTRSAAVPQGDTAAIKKSMLHPYFEKHENIPLRLSDEERHLLQVLEGALTVSEYTDNVDVYRYGKSHLVQEQLDEMLDTLVGLQTAADLRVGETLIGGDVPTATAFYRRLFEIGRRYKTMNPDKMRATYGKMMYMLQDSTGTALRLVAPIRTVSTFLEEREASALLSSPHLEDATIEIGALSDEDRKHQAQRREAATRAILDEHVSDTLSKDDIMLVLSSIRDSNSYQTSNARPVQRMLFYLTELFSPDERSSARSLRLSYGEDGAKLSHSHATQYTFVKQSLLLWLNITQQMFGLWLAADDDLLSGPDYRLCNTGQGLNRVQSCPNVSRAMHGILGRVQAACGGWVGLSVVHLGDRDVPNALVFIDKYTQLPRILGPLASILDRLEAMEKDPSTSALIALHGGAAKLRLDILADYFKSGFNGDGDDGGSCIDGRLTSTWNWCSRVHKKPFYDIFLLAGFQGFDGSFRA